MVYCLTVRLGINAKLGNRLSEMVSDKVTVWYVAEKLCVLVVVAADEKLFALVVVAVWAKVAVIVVLVAMILALVLHTAAFEEKQNRILKNEQ